MKRYRYIVFVLAALLMTGCGVKKKAVSDQPSEVSQPTWQTCLIQGAKATISKEGERYSGAVTMQTVRDSMIVVSVMPLLGIEMIRLEATPQQLKAIDKVHGQYAETTFTELNNKLTPTLSWEILQQVCSAELPTGPNKARLMYALGKEQIEITIDYTAPMVDVPVRVNRIRTDRYTKIDITKWLR